jgi:UDP-N-acetylmuramoyl-tripeptide--D-alanyl-D-alanine ligase
MDATPLSQVASWAGGRLLAGGAGAMVARICTDSRALTPGDLFVALRGENFDAHSFVAEAARIGAVGAIVEKVPLGLPAEFGIIEVLDTLKALQELGRNYRASLPVRVVGITGSNGKTSTKDFTAAIFAKRFRTSKTAGNLNNHIGVPLTLLSLGAADEIAIVEMGMNHPGEIAPLAALARPDAAIITNIGVAHIEYMGTREAIALEKGELAAAVGEAGVIILNADDDFSPAIAARCKAKVITAGIGQGDVHATNLEPISSGIRFRIHATGRWLDAELPVPGEHMVRNALLACAAGLDFGLTLEECVEGLREPGLSKGRLQQKHVAGLTILDDSYNANPDSMTAGLATLVQCPGDGRRIAVLGRMGELGSEAESGHRRVGFAAGKLGLSCLITVGDEAAWIADSAAGVREIVRVADTNEAARALKAFAKPGDVVLVKGSRSSKMERVIAELEQGGQA